LLPPATGAQALPLILHRQNPEYQEHMREVYLPMKRDMDLIRTILLKIEVDPSFDSLEASAKSITSAARLGITGYNDAEVSYHLAQLVDAELLVGNTKMASRGLVIVSKLSWQGHEFLDAVRDPDVWRKTKERAKGIATVGFGFLLEIAKAEVKTKLGLP
jgi:Hypothetical protein (DUF2513)